MLFPTIDFAVFLAFVLVAAAVARRLGNTVNKLLLVATSLAFYSFWSIGFAALMVGVAVMIYLVGLSNRLIPNRRLRITFLAASIVIALGILAYFKYYNFFILLLFNSSVTRLFGFDLQFIEVVTPVAISFFTFHAISYVVDTYRNPSLALKSPTDVLLYISFFPHLVAGPIVRASTFIPQLAATPTQTAMRYAEALMLILSGLWKKMIAANYLAVLIVEPVFNAPSLYGPGDLALAAVAYAFQIYFDFSAYSSIAIGVAALLGYHFPENFDQPYRSLSVREFWRRWHITLSSWLRDYLYIPLGGSRVGNVRLVLNLMITMVLGGLWHGANTTFLVWGALHGAGLVLVHFWARTALGKRLAGRFAFNVLCWLLTFVFLLATWIVFRSPDLDTAGQYFAGLFATPAAPELATGLVLGLIALGFVGQFLPPTLRSATAAWLGARALPTQIGLATVAMFGLLLIAPSQSAPFIYFQF